MSGDPPVEVGDRLELVSRYFGPLSSRGTYEVLHVRESGEFGSGIGVQVSPAIDERGESVWFDLAHFRILPP